MAICCGDDSVTSYNSKGPALLDHAAKPDLVAPGNIVYARMQPSQYLVRTYQSNSVGVSMGMGPTISNVFLLSGTSMAAPVVSGAAALLYQKDSTLTPHQVKARLMKTAFKGFMPSISIYISQTAQSYFVQHDIFAVGAGYLDVKAAFASTEKIGPTQLALVHPARQGNQQEAERVQERRHLVASLSDDARGQLPLFQADRVSGPYGIEFRPPHGAMQHGELLLEREVLQMECG